MHYSDSLEQSSEYLRIALGHMGKLRIPVDPANYSVWYEYVSGRNHQLKVTIDSALSSPESLTPELSRTFYEKYIAVEHRELVKKIREELRGTLDVILGNLVETGCLMTNFGTMINLFSQKLQEDLDGEDIRNIVNDIVSETKALERSGMLFKEKIHTSTREIEKLRIDLDRVRQEALTDVLTGLWNRRYLHEIFEREARHAQAAGTGLSAIMLDIDHFKKINDSYGHVMGDRVLKTASRMIKDCVKGRDIVVRYGGEEFMVLLPDTTLQGATALAEQICTYFKKMSWKRKDTGENIGHIYVSLGVAQFRPGESLDTLLQRVDDALYLSKTNGRGMVMSETSLQRSAWPGVPSGPSLL